MCCGRRGWQRSLRFDRKTAKNNSNMRRASSGFEQQNKQELFMLQFGVLKTKKASTFVQAFQYLGAQEGTRTPTELPAST